MLPQSVMAWETDGSTLLASYVLSTLIDSTGGVLVTWEVYGKEHNLDLVEVLKSMSSISSACTIRP